jgi:3-oxoacyl-[acyl-carrier-protein] synthase-1
MGMVTPLGHGAEASCAAIRAGLTRFSELPGIELDGAPVVGASVHGVTCGHLGLDRFTRLAASAVEDLVRAATMSERELGVTGLYVALPPEGRPSLDARIAGSIGRRIGEQCGIAGVEARTRVFPVGHAGAVQALAEATNDLHAKRFSRAIVGGVDSLVEPGTIAHYHALGRLKIADRPVGVMPGEAAAFFLVELLPAAEARRATIAATIDGAATAVESVTIDADDVSGVCDGAGLTEAARQTLAALPDRGGGIGLLVGDLNGEPYRSEEIAYMAARALDGVATPWRLWHAADAIGDTGAAAGAVAIVTAARALARGYARTETVLCFASSEGGLRGTVALRKHKGKG